MVELSMDAHWAGKKNIREAPQSPEYEFTDGLNTCERTFSGPRATLLANKPAIGKPMEGFDPLLLVERVRIRGGRGGDSAIMTVSLRYDYEGDATDPTAGAGQWVKEIDWVTVDVPLIHNDRYIAGGEKELTVDDFDAIREWERQGRPALSALEFSESASWDNAKDYIAKILKGREVFRTSYPVCRRSRTLRGCHSEGAAYIQTCPMAEKPDGYLWLKTADRCTKTGRNGKWVQFQEWSGFKDIDTDLYYVVADAGAFRRFKAHFDAMQRAKAAEDRARAPA